MKFLIVTALILSSFMETRAGMKILIVTALILSSFMETRAGAEDFCRVLQPQDRRNRWDVCDVTLDPNTAHTRLILSEGNRKVEHVKERQSYPDRPERFDHWEQVLSVENFTGSCYWEVEWSGKVYISVSYGGIQRKGGSNECLFGKNKNSWSMFCSKSYFSVLHNINESRIPALPPPSNRVGVYLDWEGGTVSFYTIPPNTHTLTHLHTLTTTFTEPLYAGFTLWEAGSSVRFY
ncbi:stonustoxin subunit beta-like [Hoplias malabaricus]|uniref:stonustoxin subunit beta-like n=1 Tax=Hoplias malabaricus TaxID=27720 RepID=UPI003461A391